MAGPSAKFTSDGLTKHGKRVVATAMFEKGVSFVGAAVLLRDKEGYEQVVLHLICQGLENILKSILLLEDFHKYRKYIKNNIGHDLEKAVQEVIKVKHSSGITIELSDEIARINCFYKGHWLKYGTMADILMSTQNIDSELVQIKLLQLIKVMRYKLARGA